MNAEAFRLPPAFWPLGAFVGEMFWPALLSPEEPQPMAPRNIAVTASKSAIRAIFVINAPPRLESGVSTTLPDRLYLWLLQLNVSANQGSVPTHMLNCVNHIVTRFAAFNAKPRQLLQKFPST
jgi:hypothetical protein